MSEHPSARRDNILLGLAALLLGVSAAVAYAAWRYVSLDDGGASERWGEFGEAMLFPGALIIGAVAAMVWLGWKANIDG
jgi:hypothetical protein